ncbi:hypothetical protein MNB_SM-4-1702 [hydrothermal vent metagenome]|uniref:Uncharacterized protein n=1 Tax=hydrothermal vent metagenome TaxID=652676 RepID=A0A1W1BLR6_9ZZZZ
MIDSNKKIYNIDTNIDYKQVSGTISDIYRIREGNIRILVKIKDDEIIIEGIITTIGFPRDIYK